MSYEIYDTSTAILFKTKYIYGLKFYYREDFPVGIVHLLLKNERQITFESISKKVDYDMLTVKL